MKKHIRIATRPSPLAIKQAQLVQCALVHAYPNIQCEFVLCKTQADRDQKTAIIDLGGKGIFIKALEEALLVGDADIAVHSLKDLPCQLATPFQLCAVIERGAAQDVLLTQDGYDITTLPKNAIVGTSSIRRACQIRSMRSDVITKPIRGNIATRIQHLAQGYDAVILAAAGLERLNIPSADYAHFTIEDMVPAPSQGAIGIECLAKDTEIQQCLESINHTETKYCTDIERAIMYALGGHCFAPIGIYAHMHNQSVQVHAFISNKDASTVLTLDKTFSHDTYQAISHTCADQLIQHGALELIATTQDTP